MANRFMLNETSYHGHGAIKNIVPEIKCRGFEKILVCTDSSLVRFGVSKKVTDLLDEADIKYEMFTDIKPNPTIENVLAGVKAAKEAKVDAIVAQRIVFLMKAINDAKNNYPELLNEEDRVWTHFIKNNK